MGYVKDMRGGLAGAMGAEERGLHSKGVSAVSNRDLDMSADKAKVLLQI